MLAFRMIKSKSGLGRIAGGKKSARKTSSMMAVTRSTLLVLMTLSHTGMVGCAFIESTRSSNADNADNADNEVEAAPQSRINTSDGTNSHLSNASADSRAEASLKRDSVEDRARAPVEGKKGRHAATGSTHLKHATKIEPHTALIDRPLSSKTPQTSRKKTSIEAAKSTPKPQRTVKAPKQLKPMFETIEQLPLLIDETWHLDIVRDDKSDRMACLIRSQGITIDDGHGGTSLEFQISEHEIAVKTDSNIDISYEYDGVKVDRNKLVEIDYIRGQQSAVFKIDPKRFIQNIEKAKLLKIQLGFWPTWPMTKTQSATLNVSNLTQAAHLLSRCKTMIHK